MGVQLQNNITKKRMKKNRIKKLVKENWMDRMKDKKRGWKWFKFYTVKGTNNEEGC